MLDLSNKPRLKAELEKDEPGTVWLLFDIQYASGNFATEHWTTKQGIIEVDGNTYLPLRTALAVDPPELTAGAIDQNFFSLALAPESEEEMEVELDKWLGRTYPQAFDLSNPILPGISMRVKFVMKTTPETLTSETEIWTRDSSVRIIPDTADLVRAWVNIANATPPEIGIAPEQLPAGIFTATRGSSTAATEPVYMQRLRYSRSENDLWVNFGTEWEFVGAGGDPNDATAALAVYNASPAVGNRWLTPDAEQRYALRIQNRQTREYRDIPFRDMTRGEGTARFVNYSRGDPNLEPFMSSLPNYTDTSLPESFRQYGARTSIVEYTETKSEVTESLTLYRGKLHSVVKTLDDEGGWRIVLGFSGPFAKVDNTTSINISQAEQRARDNTDGSMDGTSETTRIDWGVKG